MIKSIENFNIFVKFPLEFSELLVTNNDNNGVKGAIIMIIIPPYNIKV